MFYRHFKGKYYQVVAEALDTSTEQPVVIYRTLYSCEHAWFTRSVSDFFGKKLLPDGSEVARFSPVSHEELPPSVKDFLFTLPNSVFSK